MKIFIVALEIKRADENISRLQVAMVEAETPSEAISKAIELSILEDITTAKVISVFDNIEECKDIIIAEVETPFVHVDVW
ncbi:MAG: hypothetical protein ACTSPB_03535 [Candidatus Thorarchaeota archaeon]